MVETILDEREKDGLVQFLIKWEGFPEPTWEPESNLTAKMVSAYRLKAKQQKDKETTEYVVEKILKERNSKGLAEFLIKWEGYDETTWEPETNLKGRMISAFRKKQTLVCATCGDPGGLGSACEVCKKSMHHFCATTVCEELHLTDVNGTAIVEFPNDRCYCSRQCYEQSNAESNAGINEDEEDLYEPEKEVTPLRAISSGIAGRTTNDQAKKRKASGTASSKSTSKSNKSKTKTKPLLPYLDSVSGQHADPLIGKQVAFCGDQESWMTGKQYKDISTFYIPGRVHKATKIVGEKADTQVYEIRWSYTQFQGKPFKNRVTRSVVERGIQNHDIISGSVLNGASWKKLCQVPATETWTEGTSLDDYVMFEGSKDAFLPKQFLPENLEQVEQIKNFDFQASHHMKTPADLFTRDDGSSETRIKKEHAAKFAHSASSSFLAYLPVAFWKTVVVESNKYASSQKGPQITLSELLKFLGIMFYMSIVDKGEYSNYWGMQVDSRVLGGTSLGLENVMSLKRFQFIRNNFAFAMKSRRRI